LPSAENDHLAGSTVLCLVSFAMTIFSASL
jgi:hypothetical protein